MPSNAGDKQEGYLFDHLRFERHCVQVVQGDHQVRSFLGMIGAYKCADALGLHQPLIAVGNRRITVAESKGTDMDSALEQLGNAAGGVFEKFGRETRIDLLVMIPALTQRPSGALSPGPGYHASPLKTGRNKFTLQEAMGGPPTAARARVTYPQWMKWNPQVASLRVVTLVLADAT